MNHIKLLFDYSKLLHAFSAVCVNTHRRQSFEDVHAAVYSCEYNLDKMVPLVFQSTYTEWQAVWTSHVTVYHPLQHHVNQRDSLGD